MRLEEKGGENVDTVAGGQGDGKTRNGLELKYLGIQI